MARGNQTFQKRQRENKLREKALQKRQRREQRKSEKKQLLASERAFDQVEPGNPLGIAPVHLLGGDQ
jgi:hypothetical protein